VTAPRARVASPAIKVCGLTRALDADRAAALGASFLGGIRAGGPRRLETAEWRAVVGTRRAGVTRVAVLGHLSVSELVRDMAALGADVAQWHGDPSAPAVAEVRDAGIRCWPVLRIAGASLPPLAWELAEHAEALVLDAKVPGQLGGTGVPLDWEALAEEVAAWRHAYPAVRLVLAGGLHADNVQTAIGLLRPDVVDVSSGVESAPGIKDPERLQAFVHAVRG
jgi:phosphoribosylanthranilate isomerase